jgi:hypothetical protein
MNPNTQQTTGEHLLLIRGTHWNSGLSPAELQRIMTDFYGWVEGLQNKGMLRGAQPLMEEGRLVTGAQTSSPTASLPSPRKPSQAISCSPWPPPMKR